MIRNIKLKYLGEKNETFEINKIIDKASSLKNIKESITYIESIIEDIDDLSTLTFKDSGCNPDGTGPFNENFYGEFKKQRGEFIEILYSYIEELQKDTKPDTTETNESIHENESFRTYIKEKLNIELKNTYVPDGTYIDHLMDSLRNIEANSYDDASEEFIKQFKTPRIAHLDDNTPIRKNNDITKEQFITGCLNQVIWINSLLESNKYAKTEKELADKFDYTNTSIFWNLIKVTKNGVFFQGVEPYQKSQVIFNSENIIDVLKSLKAIKEVAPEARTKNVIIECFNEVFDEDMPHPFRTEKEYNEATKLLAYFFESGKVKDINTIKLNKSVKTKFSKALKIIHSKLSNAKDLRNDSKYFNLIKKFSDYEDMSDDKIYKALTK
jgi:hypothetical protein